MAWRLADSSLTHTTPATAEAVNRCVADFSSPEGWLPERNPLSNRSQFAEGRTWGPGVGMGMGNTGSRLRAPLAVLGAPENGQLQRPVWPPYRKRREARAHANQGPHLDSRPRTPVAGLPPERSQDGPTGARHAQERSLNQDV